MFAALEETYSFQSYNLMQVVGQIHEIDNESITDAYLQEKIEPQDVWSL